MDLQTNSLCLTLADEQATQTLAHRMASRLSAGDVVALWGDLGAGKTAFSRALIRALGQGDEDVPSPTFTLVQTYDLPRVTVWHFDLYRLSHPDEVIELDWDDARATGVLLVEWPDRLGMLLPRDRLDMTLTILPDGMTRCVMLQGHGLWADRLAALSPLLEKPL